MVAVTQSSSTPVSWCARYCCSVFFELVSRLALLRLIQDTVGVAATEFILRPDMDNLDGQDLRAESHSDNGNFKCPPHPAATVHPF